MVGSVGVDIEEVQRFENGRISKEFLDNVFTKREVDYCVSGGHSSASFAGKFCAKEAVIKALGNDIFMKDIEILNDECGKILVYIKEVLRKDILCSISHTKDFAVAFVVVERD